MRSRLAFGGMLACLSLLAVSVHVQTTLTGGWGCSTSRRS
jgi:hypothetical protein